jgi:alpha-1,2-mannosyltransferase
MQVRAPAAYRVRMRASWPSRGDAMRIAVDGGLIAAALVPILLGRPRPLDPIDLVVYRTAGESAIHGWSLYAPSFLEHSGGHLAFTYPPFAALCLSPLALLPLRADYLVWSVLCLLALWALVKLSFRDLLARCAARQRGLAAVGITAAAILTVPVAEHLTLGQVGIPLTLMCLADVVPSKTRWPRGLLVGLAAAVKLTPALFVVYFLVTRQWRATVTAVVTTGGAWLLGALAMPGDSRGYFLDGVGFDPQRLGAVLEVANQSLWGTLHRWLGSGGQLPWLVLSPLIVVVGLYRARLAHRAGDRLAAAALVGLTSLLVSPVSWMHSGVWLVPALAALVGDGRRRRHVLSAVVVWLVLMLLVPHPAPAVATGVDSWYVKFVAHEILVYVYLALLVLLPVRGPRRLRISYPSMVATRV